MKSVNRDDTDTTMYMGYADGYVRYSNDGIAYYNKRYSNMESDIYNAETSGEDMWQHNCSWRY